MSGVNFAEIEQQFVRDRINPDFTWRAYDDYSPLNRMTANLGDARVALVTTVGAHLEDQEPFDLKDPAGDPTFREIPTNVSSGDLELTHRGYNTRQSKQDPNVVVPVDHLKAARECGRIGGLGSNIYSFMGFIADTDPLMDESAPEVARRLKADRTDLVLLVPT